MPVLTKAQMEQLRKQLAERYQNLDAALKPRDLRSAREGAKKGAWMYPDKMCATEGSPLDLQLAVDDFRAILAQVRTLK